MSNRSFSRIFALVAVMLMASDVAQAAKTGSDLETSNQGAKPSGWLSLKGTKGTIDPSAYLENLSTLYANNPPPHVSGRQLEVQELDFALDPQNHSRRTALLLGDPGSGRTSLMTQFTLNHPLDTVYRLNMDRVSRLNDEDRNTMIREVIAHVKGLENKNPGGRTVLYIPDMTALASNSGVVDPILNSIAFKTIAPLMVLEIDPTANSKLFKEHQDLYKLVSVIEPKPAAYDAVLTHLYNEQDSIRRQAGGLAISRSAIEEAARLSVRYRAASPFTVADQILRQAALRVYNETANQQTEISNIDRNLKAWQTQMDSILEELKNGDVKGIAAQRLEQTRATLQTRIDQATQRKAALGTPAMGDRQLLVQVQRQIEEIKTELQVLNADSGLLSRGANSSKKSSLQAQLQELTVRQNDLLADRQELQLERAGQPGRRLTANHVQIVAADLLKVPLATLAIDMREAASQIGRLSEEVVNQDHIIKEAAHFIPTELAHRELVELGSQNATDELKNKRGEKPIWTAYLGGESGTGKTEFFKQLAEFLGMDFELFEMTKYKETHALSELIGAPPGYVGYEQGGRLTEFVRNHPNSVILFDEIEKGNPAILDIFLQIGDEGILTDSQGRKVDFRHTIIGYTTNVGAQYLKMDRATLIEEIVRNFSGNENELKKMNLEELRRTALFNELSMRTKVELIKRADFVGLTNSHNEFSIKAINMKLIRGFSKTLANLNMKFVVSESALDLMQGHYTDENARNLKGNFKRAVENPIMSLLPQVRPGEVIMVDGSNGKLEFLHGPESQFKSALVSGNAVYEKSDLKRTRDALLKQAGAASDPNIKAKRLFDERVMIRDAVVEAFRAMGKK
jgi:hypothetical protein